MKTTLNLSLVLLLVAAVCGTAQAKLPAPSDEAKASAAAAAEKAGWGNKVAAYQLCQSQDKVVAHYLAQTRAAGKPVTAPLATSPCADPGPFVMTAEAKPIEAAGAHSPAATAISPPSTNSPDAVVNPAKKP